MRNEKLIFTSHEDAPGAYTSFINSFSVLGQPRPVISSVWHMDSMLYLIRANKGVTIMPECFCSPDPSLRFIPMVDEPEKIYLTLSCKSSRTHDCEIESFIEELFVHLNREKRLLKDVLEADSSS